MLAQRILRGAVFILASSYTNMALGLAYGMIMARLLTPEQFGLFALATFYFGLFDIRGKLGLDYAFIHHSATPAELVVTHWKLQMAAALVSLGVLGIVGSGVGLLATTFGYPSTLGWLFVGLAGAMVLEAAGTTARVGLEKELAFGRSTLVITVSLALSYLAAIWWAAQGGTYWALLGQVAVNAGLTTAGFWWVYRRLAPPFSLRQAFDRPLAKWLLRYGAVMVLGSLATLLLLQFDNFLVGTFIGAAALGYYAQAYKVAQWPTGLVTHIISRVSLPTYAKLQNDPRRLSKAFEMSLWAILVVASPLALAIFVSAPDFLTLLYTDKWLPSAPLLRFLIGYAVLRPLLDDTGALFTAIGKPKLITQVLIVQAVTLVLVATPLTIGWGAAGTAIGVGIAFLIGIGLTYRFVSQTLAIDLPRLFLPAIAGTLGSLGVYWLISRLVDLNGLPLWLRVGTKGALAAGLFGLIVVALEWRTIGERLGYLWRLWPRKTNAPDKSG